MELHGDRLYSDDKAIVGGIAYLDDMPVTVIGEQKGKINQRKYGKKLLECQNLKDIENL